MPTDPNQAILAASPFAMLIIDREERIVRSNMAATRLLGTGLDTVPFVNVLRQPAFGEACEAALRHGIEGRIRLRLTSAEGGETIQLVSVAVLPPAPEGPVKGPSVLVSFEDITALEEAEAMRRDFVANVSHELRTPLTALMGFVETLRHSARDDAKARDRFLSIMEREASRMNRLVGDLLSLSRVESEERQRPRGTVDISVVLKGAIQTLSHTAEAQGVELIREGETGELRVPGDPDQLTQVFSNLIENAIKYGGQGGEVRVTVIRVGTVPGLRGPALRIEVADKGEGIDPLHLPRLTERFYRVDTHRSCEQGGTGLGLAIVKHIVSRHRGRLKIDSKKGEGSRFSVILPTR